MVQPGSRRLVTESALAPLKTRVDALDPNGQRGYIVDQSAGRTVRVWDYLNQREQVIYGDTGLRNITALTTAGAGVVLLSRQGNTVFLYLNDVVPGPSLVPNASYYDLIAPGALPSGFRPALTLWSEGPGHAGSNAPRLWFAIAKAGWLPIYSGAAANNKYRLMLSYPTPDPWPTTLPGTAI